MANPAIPPALAIALAERPTAEQRFYAFPVSVQHEWITYIEQAKRPTTQQQRIAYLLQRLAVPTPNDR